MKGMKDIKCIENLLVFQVLLAGIAVLAKSRWNAQLFSDIVWIGLKQPDMDKPKCLQNLENS